jgi:hypothetical protein
MTENNLYLAFFSGRKKENIAAEDAKFYFGTDNIIYTSHNYYSN